MVDETAAAPDSTAVRVALWQAMLVEVDEPPHVLRDGTGLRLATPDENWRRRPDIGSGLCVFEVDRAGGRRENVAGWSSAVTAASDLRTTSKGNRR
jgi:hypothetical protein